MFNAAHSLFLKIKSFALCFQRSSGHRCRMQSVQRRFGKLLPRTADESQVAVLLKDFDEAEKMLAKIIEGSKAWRDSWRDILGTQERLVHGFQTIYSPIIGAEENYSGHEPVEAPRSTMERTIKLQEAYVGLRTDLLEEVETIEARIIKPASDAKDSIHPLRKIIKKRGDRKLDFEKYQARVDTSRKKTNRSDRDNASLAKAELELDRAREEYTIADDRLKSSLPPVITATFSLLPQLLSAQILIQNTLLSHSYTLLHEFCEEENFPSPPPAMNQVIATWNAQFKPIQHEIENGLGCIARGKARHQSMRTEDQGNSTASALTIRNGNLQRRATSQSQLAKSPVSPPVEHTKSETPSPDQNERPRIYSVPSQNSLSLAMPNYTSSGVRTPSPGEIQKTHSPAGPKADYFSRDRVPSASSTASSSMASIAAKKKKPPPPPLGKKPSTQALWVTALYEFAGEGQGDLAFREGDRIRVIKKTDSTDDWWEGELKGIQGSFPANYCEAT